jgi:hypothetical protein
MEGLLLNTIAIVGSMLPSSTRLHLQQCYQSTAILPFHHQLISAQLELYGN